MLCRKCKQKLKETRNGAFDGFGFMGANPLYCENKECDEFGYVVMVGYPDGEKDNNH